LSSIEAIIFSRSTKPLRTLIGLLVVLGAIFLWTWPQLPISDPPSYFNFSDTRSFGSFPNACNVISNLAFLLIGIIGIKKILKNIKAGSVEFVEFGFALAVGSVLTCFGSMYFHWSPSSATLVWDRLPMTIGFAAINGLVIADRIDQKLGRVSLIGLILLGLFSIVGYNQSWLTLKPYIAVQFGTLLFLALAILLLRVSRISNSIWWSTIGLYVIAKVFELADDHVFDITGVISGHTLKHFFAGLSIYKVLTIFDRESK
jgi:hypothetical protein